ncbi:hypothetical protein N9J72_00630 [Candidatus Gracilibacteria bacterium]|nr:hypothetical protein [Candidatus Gracilibacteria bacterium]
MVYGLEAYPGEPIRPKNEAKENHEKSWEERVVTDQAAEKQRREKELGEIANGFVDSFARSLGDFLDVRFEDNDSYSDLNSKVDFFGGKNFNKIVQNLKNHILKNIKKEDYEDMTSEELTTIKADIDSKVETFVSEFVREANKKSVEDLYNVEIVETQGELAFQGLNYYFAKNSEGKDILINKNGVGAVVGDNIDYSKIQIHSHVDGFFIDLNGDLDSKIDLSLSATRKEFLQKKDQDGVFFFDSSKLTKFKNVSDRRFDLNTGFNSIEEAISTIRNSSEYEYPDGTASRTELARKYLTKTIIDKSSKIESQAEALALLTQIELIEEYGNFGFAKKRAERFIEQSGNDGEEMYGLGERGFIDDGEGAEEVRKEELEESRTDNLQDKSSETLKMKNSISLGEETEKILFQAFGKSEITISDLRSKILEYINWDDKLFGFDAGSPDVEQVYGFVFQVALSTLGNSEVTNKLGTIDGKFGPSSLRAFNAFLPQLGYNGRTDVTIQKEDAQKILAMLGGHERIVYSGAPSAGSQRKGVVGGTNRVIPAEEYNPTPKLDENVSYKNEILKNISNTVYLTKERRTEIEKTFPNPEKITAREIFNYFNSPKYKKGSVTDIFAKQILMAAELGKGNLVGKIDGIIGPKFKGAAKRYQEMVLGMDPNDDVSELNSSTRFSEYAMTLVKKRLQDRAQPLTIQADLVTRPENLEKNAENFGQRIVDSAMKAKEAGDTLGAADCTIWVMKIYEEITGKILHDFPKLYDPRIIQLPVDQRIDKDTDTGYRTDEYADIQIIRQIRAGYHIMVDHGPDFGTGKTHSVIALGTPDKDGIVQVVSYPAKGKLPLVEWYDLTGKGKGDMSGDSKENARPEKVMRIHRLYEKEKDQPNEKLDSYGELSGELGDWIIENYINEGKNSCGKAVGNALIRMGFKGLPTSGRDGYKFEQILDERPSQFEKVRVSSPWEVKAGGILVYSEGARLGTRERHDFGHVEIRGSDGKFYSYLGAIKPGGSSRTEFRNEKQYTEDTGFIGYAYYPVSKTA